MRVALAAGGTGGHVFPALAVAEAIGDRADLVFLGGHRLEATVVPAAGIELVQAAVRGLERSFTLRNLGIPTAVWAATRLFASAMRDRGVKAVLATGGYVTVPAALAARRLGLPYFLHEQNAHAGLANRLMGRWAEATFTSFPGTVGARREVHVGNPIRAAIVGLDRGSQREPARHRYGLDRDRPTIGIVGGSLGSGPINAAMIGLAPRLAAAGVQVLHLAGRRFADEVESATAGLALPWRVVGFEEEMQWFYAAVDLVVARASGMVAEFTATGTPAVLIPGEFGSKGHQAASALYLERAGAARLVPESQIDSLGTVVLELVNSDPVRAEMATRALAIGRPDAAKVIAEEVLRAAGR